MYILYVGFRAALGGFDRVLAGFSRVLGGFFRVRVRVGFGFHNFKIVGFGSGSGFRIGRRSGRVRFGFGPGAALIQASDTLSDFIFVDKEKLTVKQHHKIQNKHLMK